MRNNILIFSGVLFILALIAALINVTGNQSDSIESVDTEAVLEEDTDSYTGVGTLPSLAQFGERLECQISYQATADASEIVGSYFVDGERARGDFVLTDESLGEVVSSYIIDGDTLFAWSLIGGEKYGVKATGDFFASPANLPIPEAERVRYECETWTQYDGSIFLPPGDVLFRDGSEVQAEFGTIYE